MDPFRSCNDKPLTITLPGGRTTTIDPNDDWVKVELFRWQYGVLPHNDSRPLNVAEGLRKMAAAFEQEDTSKWPAPFNVQAVLNWCATRVGSNV